MPLPTTKLDEYKLLREVSDDLSQLFLEDLEESDPAAYAACVAWNREQWAREQDPE